MKRSTICPTLLLCAALAGCATGPNANPADPLEPFNRSMFTFNDKLDQYVARPLAQGYQAITPSPIRTGVTNFFSNLGDVGNTINNLLQGKLGDGMESLMRVAINTVFGIGGVLDVATPAGLPRHSQDFGLTLGNWGVPSGSYLVLPLFGPSTFRDAPAMLIDLQLDPLTYVDSDTRLPLRVLNIVNTRANLLNASTLLEEAALDKYTFVRDAWSQQRQNKINEGKESALPKYEEAEEEKKP
jgi:phospholipid-binding lipoprotein MlaA